MKGTPTPIETQAFSHFSRVVCYAKGTTKIGSFLERKKAERFDILFQRTEGIPPSTVKSTTLSIDSKLSSILRSENGVT